MQFSLWVFIAVTITACRNSPSETIPVVSEDVSSDFADFYYRFHRDSAFQMSHIRFPVEGKREADSDQFYWYPEDWVLHRPFDDMGVYKQSLHSFQGIIVETISDRSVTYTMERRWMPTDSSYQLIYYKEMGAD